MDERVGSGTADVTLSGVTAGFRKGVVLNRGVGFRLAPTPASVWRVGSSGELKIFDGESFTGVRRGATLGRVGKRGGVDSGPCLFAKRDVEGDEKKSSVSIMLRALSGDGDIVGE